MMSNLALVVSSDWHIGVKTDEIDRTKEIVKVGKQIVKHCIKLIEGGYEVKLILAGDIFNTNTPSEQNISAFLSVLGLIKKAKLKTIVMVGNHDAVSDPNRLSCLDFIKTIKVGYPTVSLIEDIKFMNLGTFDNGPLYATFLPHISKATIQHKINEKKLDEVYSPQEYIDMKCDQILKKVGRGSQHLVFSHLNVSGAHPGSEEELLKKSNVYLPKVFTNTPVGYIQPTIMQGHIHSHQINGNVHIIGSPIYCTFGESGNKYFAEILISNQMGKDNEINYIPTKHRQFAQLELDMLNEEVDFFKIPQVVEFLKTIDEKRSPIVKFNIIINPEHNSYDWKLIKQKLEKKIKCTVKKIEPRIISKRTVRSVDQKITLSPKDAVKVFLKKNMRKDKKLAQLIYSTSLKYLEE